MEAYIIEWLNMLGRWVHMITGIAWIGASFYFVWLDNHLQTPKEAADSEKGVGGEVWSVHGGGFYHAQKYKLAPPAMPDHLHWFKWEAYTTWITGMFMLALIYWYTAEIYLIDPNVAALSKPVAIVIGIATLVLGWVVYDRLCKSKLGEDEKKLAVALFVFVVIVAFVLTRLFSGRGAYIHFGAMLGTIMVANVFFVIMPGQRALVGAASEGRAPDAIHGITAKQRSVHNTYFTLPVLFVMISNHYAMTYGSYWNWLILIAISLAGALIRVYFVQRHFGKASLAPVIVAALILLAVSFAFAPRMSASGGAGNKSAAEVFADVQSIVVQRCSSCHAAAPSQPGFTAPPKGVIFDSPESIVMQAALIHQQTVVSKVMPIGNLTQMTDGERGVIEQWFLAGAKTE
ncbi:MAG: urate hydroxylase PuuD [Gammaproteobacteria bacterium]|nr:urate hydroxylase PuuD [Gammaproteobacteria bacterium]